MKRLKVTVEGKTYEVEVELIEDDESDFFFPTTTTEINSQETTLINTNKTTTSKDSNKIIAPMAGNITTVLVKAGDIVKSGDKIAEMEAMKMLTPLTALNSGKIKEIKVSVGDNINQGAIIAIIG